MVGYNINGYILWSEDENKIVVSRDVIFNENKFPEQTSIEDIHIIDEIKCPEPNYITEDIERTTMNEEQPPKTSRLKKPICIKNMILVHWH
jgi:hypothetical protein